MTDEWLAYQGLDKEYAGHSVVDHGRGEYVNGLAYTNTVESWIALLKRGIVGTFHHVSKVHNPEQIIHRIRSMSSTKSEANRPLIPEHVVHFLSGTGIDGRHQTES